MELSNEAVKRVSFLYPCFYFSKMLKILAGVVTHGKKRYALDYLLKRLTNQTIPVDILFVVNHGQDAYATLIRSKNIDGVKVEEDIDNPKTPAEKIISGRNYIRNYALENDYDYVLFVDSDVMIPNLAAELLIQAEADVAAGAYLNIFKLGDKEVLAPVLFRDSGKGECQLFTYEGAALPQIIDIGAAGLGCVLVKRNVLEKIKFRTFSNDRTGTDAMAFFVDAREKGFRCRAHTGVKCLHMPFPLTDPKAKLFEWKKTVRSMTAEVKLE